MGTSKKKLKKTITDKLNGLQLCSYMSVTDCCVASCDVWLLWLWMRTTGFLDKFKDNLKTK